MKVFYFQNVDKEINKRKISEFIVEGRIQHFEPKKDLYYRKKKQIVSTIHRFLIEKQVGDTIHSLHFDKKAVV